MTFWVNWDDVKNFANSAFATSLVGALAGAFAGAYAAQRVAEQSKLRDELTKEIRNVNAAITLAFAIVNSMLAMKKQHVVGLAKAYEGEVAKHKSYLAKRATGEIQGNAPHTINGDLRSLPLVSPPVQALQDIVFGKLSSIGRPLSLVSNLSDAIKSLNDSISKRNEQIKLIEAGALPPGADFPAIYLGLPYGSGHVSRQYADLIDGISSYTDDAIFAGYLLCKDLQDYGSVLVKKFQASFRGRPPGVTEADFTKAVDAGLMPNEAKYSSWFSAFREKPKIHRRWWRRES